MDHLSGPAPVTINRNDRFVVSHADGTIDGTTNEGFYASDTRFVSGYRIWTNGRVPIRLTSILTSKSLPQSGVHGTRVSRRNCQDYVLAPR